MTGFCITGLGTALPENIVTNDDLTKTLDTSDEWIVERSGIKERRMGSSVWELGTAAAKAALAKASISVEAIDVIVLATSSPHRRLPGTSVRVANELGFKGGAFDVNAACAGFVYGLVLAEGLIRAGNEKILLIGTEQLTRITDMTDRATAVLFGDGAGAAVLEATPDESTLLSYTLSTDGSLEPILYCENDGFIQMNGKEVFRQAIRIIVESSKTTLKKAGMAVEDVSVVVPHQANSRIVAAAVDRLNIDPAKVVETISWTGNVSTASIPLAMEHAVAEGQLKEGDTVLTVGFGAGMSAASALLNWSYNDPSVGQ